MLGRISGLSGILKALSEYLRSKGWKPSSFLRFMRSLAAKKAAVGAGGVKTERRGTGRMRCPTFQAAETHPVHPVKNSFFAVYAFFEPSLWLYFLRKLSALRFGRR
jgi:hypothetical protein